LTTAAADSGRGDQIEDVLRRLRHSSPDVVGVALVSAEGFHRRVPAPE
jgi:hypothetical protein